MSFTAGSKIQLQERAKRRRNAARGRECAKGTIPEIYNLAKGEVEEKRVGWFVRLRARITALWQKVTRKGNQHQARGSQHAKIPKVS